MRTSDHQSIYFVSAVAVTVGPGLRPCLRVGIEKAKEICKTHHLPLVVVNHLEGHALMSRKPPNVNENTHIKPEFPFLLLLLSGGHSQFLICRGVGDYFQLGGTLDDSLGEAFDKVARMLGVEGGGAGIESLAQTGNPSTFTFPIPMQHKQYDTNSFTFLFH